MAGAPNPRPPRVLVVGTGALACLFGGRLARFGGAEVTLTGTWREAMDAIRAHGVRVEDAAGVWAARFGTASLHAPPPDADLVLVLVKSPRTAAVAGTVARALAPDGHAVTLQNGLGNREILERAGVLRLGTGVVTLGATLLAPGHVRATPGSITLGIPRPVPDGMRLAAGLLARAGFEVALAEDIDGLLWRKLVVNCAINPLTALLGCPNGRLIADHEQRDTLIRAAREVATVARAKGIELGADPAELALAVAQQTAANHSSMLQDLRRGVPTEIDAMSGAVVREARRLGVPVPVNASLWLRVLDRERAAQAASRAAVLEA